MKKIFLFILLMTCLKAAAASHGAYPFRGFPEESGYSPCDACFLETVSGLEWTLATGTTISVKWDPVPGAAYYRVKTFDSVNLDFINSFLVVAKPSDNNATIQDLIPGVGYQFSVIPVCANGQESM